MTPLATIPYYPYATPYEVAIFVLLPPLVILLARLLKHSWAEGILVAAIALGIMMFDAGAPIGQLTRITVPVALVGVLAHRIWTARRKKKTIEPEA